jgi:hypothetical protein
MTRRKLGKEMKRQNQNEIKEYKSQTEMKSHKWKKVEKNSSPMGRKFGGTVGLLQSSKAPASGHYPKPVESSPHPPREIGYKKAN